MRAGRTERRDVPHEEGWVEFRTLSGRELDEAEQAQTKAQIAMAKNFDPETLQSIRAANTDVTRDPKDSYDKDTLIKYGVVGCSECDPCTPEAKEELDAATREWGVVVIVEMNVRPFLSENGSTPS